MNWLDIDRMIIGLLQAGNDPKDVVEDMKKHFKWNQSQADAAVMPIAARMSVLQKKHEIPTKKKTSKKKLSESK